MDGPDNVRFDPCEQSAVDPLIHKEYLNELAMLSSGLHGTEKIQCLALYANSELSSDANQIGSDETVAR